MLRIVFFVLHILITVNASVVSRVTHLCHDLAAGIDPDVVICGLSKFSQVSLNISKTIFPNASRKWTVLEDRESIFGIVKNPKDVPHWWYDDDDDRKRLAARRDNSDPREYWCWERCTSETNKLTMRDVFNPDPTGWLNESHGQHKGVRAATPSLSQGLDPIEEIEEEGD